MSTQPNPAIAASFKNRERLASIGGLDDRVPSLLEQPRRHQPVDAVVLNEKNPPGLTRFPQGMAGDQCRPIPFEQREPPNANRMALRRSLDLIGLVR